MDGKVPRCSGNPAAGIQPLLVSAFVVLPGQSQTLEPYTAKSNESLALEGAVATIDAERGASTPKPQDQCETHERNGRWYKRRMCTVLGYLGPRTGDADPNRWPGLCSLIRVRTEHKGTYGRR